MAKTIAEQLAAHFAKFNYDTLTPATRKAVKRLLLDYLGVGVAGSQTGSGKVAREFAASTGGHEQATLIGDGRRVPAMQAALARSEEHTSELQSLMRTAYAVFFLKKKTTNTLHQHTS